MNRKHLTLVGTASLLLALSSAGSANAAGFFEQLFGMAPQAAAPAPAPSPYYDGGPQGYDEAPIHRRAKRKVVVDDKPKLQKPTDLMHDATLQTGDAVMMKNGLRVYVGDDRDSQHSKSDFARIDDVDGMPKTERRALVAMDTTRNDPLRNDHQPDVLASGRSAAIAVPISQGRDIVDPKGRTIRYVGP